MACAFIQKTAVEKAIPEMDKRLTEVGLTSYPDHMRWPEYEAKVGLTSYPDHMGWPGYKAKVGLTSYPATWDGLSMRLRWG